MRQNKFDTHYQKQLTNNLTDVLHVDTHPLKTDLTIIVFNVADILEYTIGWFVCTFSDLELEMKINEWMMVCEVILIVYISTFV